MHDGVSSAAIPPHLVEHLGFLWHSADCKHLRILFSSSRATARDEIEAVVFKEAVDVFKANKLAELSALTLTELEALIS